MDAWPQEVIDIFKERLLVKNKNAKDIPYYKVEPMSLFALPSALAGEKCYNPVGSAQVM